MAIKSGLKVNESKTGVCLLHGTKTEVITLTINGVPFQSKPSMHVLEVTFDSKLLFKNHSKVTLHCIISNK